MWLVLSSCAAAAEPPLDAQYDYDFVLPECEAPCDGTTPRVCDVNGYCVCEGEPCCGWRTDEGLCSERGPDAGVRR
jgi:hypothetical protein